MIHVLRFRDADYMRVLERQRELFEGLVAKKRMRCSPDDEWLLMVEHKPVFTLGRHANPRNILAEDAIRKTGVEIVPIERGGDVTFHGPGQLVAYPIIDLECRRMGVKKYIFNLEQAVIETLAEFDIHGERLEDAPGVWVHGKINDTGHPTSETLQKICAVGVKCSRFVTMHGLALNVNTDMHFFSYINPCGFIDRGVTSIAEILGTVPDFEYVSTRLEAHLRRCLSL